MRERFLTASLVLASLAGATRAQDCSSGEVYDDGTLEQWAGAFYAGPDGMMYWLSLFTPPSYPYRYNEACFYLHRFSGIGQLSFDVLVYDDNGLGGQPGSLISLIPEMAGATTSGQWYSYDLGCDDVITSGSVWIGLRWLSAVAGNELQLGCDETTTHPYAYSVGGVWNFMGDLGAFTLMIRARGFSDPVVNATASLRNGTGINPACYQSNAPALQSTWTPQVDHSSYPGATFTVIYLYAQPGTGPILGAGEVLVDLSSARYFRSLKASTGSVDVHTQNIPNEPSLMGIPIASQALIVGPSGPQLCNAFDLVVGC